MSQSIWVNFFANAGIPAPANATYAHIFVKNRIAMDMLSEINKEYLREMGITAIGDVISILRHSKKVQEEILQDNLLSENKKMPIAKTIQIVESESKVSSTNADKVKIARRVLPEHEGKYQVHLPKGSTKKSQEILAKYSAMQSDKIKKKSIFERLTKKNEDIMEISPNEPQKMKATSSSIFKRLGQYKGLDKKSSGILKNSPQKPETKLKNLNAFKKVMMSNPSRLSSSESEIEDISVDKMDYDDSKQVKFSPAVEVRVYQQRYANTGVQNFNRAQAMKTDGIKSRLGKRKAEPSVSSLHNTIKTVSMKPRNGSTSPKVNMSKMKSDNMLLSKMSVHKRLDVRNRKFSVPSQKMKYSSMSKSSPSTSNVFKRLGQATT